MNTLTKKNRKWMAVAAFLMLAHHGLAANEIVETPQVKGKITVNKAQDYVITDKIPFTNDGSVDIENTEHAAVIIREIKPSRVLKDWLSHITIKGSAASDGQNCQVKMYGRGSII